MKKVINIIIVLMIGFLFTNVVHAANVTVKEITIDSKSDTIEVNSFSYEGLNIKTDIYFNQLNDYVKYKVILKNNDNKDYTLQDLKSNFNNEYTKVTYEYENNNKEFKANSEKVIYITFKYTKEAENISDINGTNIVITVPYENLTNPKTGVYSVSVILVFLILLGISGFALIDKKQISLSVFIIAALFMTNIYLINAVEELKLDLVFTTSVDASSTKKAIFDRGLNVIKHTFDLVGVNSTIREDDEGNYLQFDDSCWETNTHEFLCSSDILKYERSNTIPNDKKVDENIVSSSESEIPIYMWYEESTKTIKYYSEAKILYMNVDAGNMFADLSHVTQIDLSTIRTRNTTNMSDLFLYDSNLETLDLSNFNTSKVENMNYMFYGNEKIKELDLSSFDLSNIKITECDTDGKIACTPYTNAEDMFDGMTSLNKIKTPKKLPNSEFSIEFPGVFTDGNSNYFDIKNNTVTNTWLEKNNNILSFYLNNNKYYFEQNMTWNQWLKSNYNTSDLVDYLNDECYEVEIYYGGGTALNEGEGGTTMFSNTSKPIIKRTYGIQSISLDNLIEANQRYRYYLNYICSDNDM